jgi:hypothetical protein
MPVMLSQLQGRARALHGTEYTHHSQQTLTLSHTVIIRIHSQPSRTGHISMVASAWSHQHDRISMLVSAWSYQLGRISMVISTWSHQHGRFGTVVSA